MGYMTDILTAATKECTRKIDVKPDKILRPIGSTFTELIDNPCSTDLPCRVTWKIIAHAECFVGRQGETILYERCEEIESIDRVSNPCVRDS
jgi:hypothetical protein